MDLNDLRAFVQVVDHGGFTAAGRALDLPKQTLSKRIGELERRAGVRLIHRTSRSFEVTEVGQELYRHAAAMLIEAEAADNIIAGRLAEPSGTVRITASLPVVQRRLAPLMPQIARAYPKIRIVLHAVDRFVDVVQERYDLVLRTHSAPLPDSGLIQRRLDADNFWLVGSPDCADLETPFLPDALRAVPVIASGEGDTMWTLCHSDGRSQDVSIRPTFVANEGAAILAAACAGLGVARLPASMCRDAISRKSLVRLCPEWTAGSLTTTMLMPTKRGLLPAVQVVFELIVQAFAGLTGPSLQSR